jgi:tetratricopeptide (TPR) repeat protein
VVTAALVFGLGVATWALVGERAARQQAEVSASLARAEAARNAEISKFFVNGPGPGTWRGQDTTLVRAMMDELSRRAGTELSKQPQAQGDILTFIASRVVGMNDYPRAITNLEKAVEAYGRAYTNAQPRVARALAMLGKLQSSNKELVAGKTNALQGVAVARKCNDPETLAVCLLDAAESFRDSERFEPEAIPLLREAMHLRRSVVPNYFGRIESTRLLAKALAFEGKKDEAKALAQKALEEAPSDTDLRDFLHRLDSAPAEANSNRTDR